MSQNNSSGSEWGGVVIFIIAALFSLTWLTIPGSDDITGMQVMSLAFANGILVGWADNLAVALFHDGSSSALNDFSRAINIGERKFPVPILICTIIGTFLSIGGVIAVLMARSAESVGQAFALGFFAEIGEGIVYNVGYYATTGRNGVTPEEIGVTFIVAIIMGFVAMGVNSRASHNA